MTALNGTNSYGKVQLRYPGGYAAYTQANTLGYAHNAPVECQRGLMSGERRVQMPWWQSALLGTGGGALVELLAVFRCVATWQRARQNRDGTLKKTPPELRRYVDIPAHTIMLPARAVLGAVAATVFGVTGQVTGPYGAVAFGCAAPVLLAQLGSIPQVERAVKGIPGTAKPQRDQVGAATADVPAKESRLS